MSARDSPGPRSWIRPRRILAACILIAAAAIAAAVLVDNGDELLTAADALTRLSWGWVTVALLAEAASYLARGAGQSILLGQAPPASVPSRGLRPGVLTLGAATLAGDAAAYCLPFGFAASGVVMFRALRARNVDAGVAGWMFGLSTLLYLSGMGLITLGAVELAGSADPVPDLQQAALILMIALLVIALAYLALNRGPLVALVQRRRQRRSDRNVLHGAQSTRRARRPDRVWGSLRRRLGTHLEVLRAIRVPPLLLAASMAMMLISWFTDIAVLGLAYEAVGSSPPWLGLLLAYCAGQLASAMPVTPGGLGVVEGSLTLALVAFGSTETTSLAAVLLYRLITYWLCIPVGALAWIALRATAPRQRASDPNTSGAPPRTLT